MTQSIIDGLTEAQDDAVTCSGCGKRLRVNYMGWIWSCTTCPAATPVAQELRREDKL